MKSGSLQVFVNDRITDVAEGQVLAGVVRDLGAADRKGVAVAVNGAVVPRSAWEARPLAAGDRVLVIRATQGG